MKSFFSLRTNLDKDIKLAVEDMVSRILKEKTHSYELFSGWYNNTKNQIHVVNDGDNIDPFCFSDEYHDMIHRVKTLITSATVDQIADEFSRQILEMETEWAELWVNHMESNTVLEYGLRVDSKTGKMVG